MAKILKVNPLWLMGFDVPMENETDYLYTDGKSDFLIEITRKAKSQDFVDRMMKYMSLIEENKKSVDDMIDFLYSKEHQGEN